MNLIDRIKVGWSLARLLTRTTGEPMVVTVQAVLIWRLFFPDKPLKMYSTTKDDAQPKWIEVKWT